MNGLSGRNAGAEPFERKAKPLTSKPGRADPVGPRSGPGLLPEVAVESEVIPYLPIRRAKRGANPDKVRTLLRKMPLDSNGFCAFLQPHQAGVTGPNKVHYLPAW